MQLVDLWDYFTVIWVSFGRICTDQNFYYDHGFEFGAMQSLEYLEKWDLNSFLDVRKKK